MNTLTPQEVATLLGCKVACCKSYEWSGAKYIYYAISNGTPINITYYYAKKAGLTDSELSKIDISDGYNGIVINTEAGDELLSLQKGYNTVNGIVILLNPLLSTNTLDLTIYE